MPPEQTTGKRWIPKIVAWWKGEPPSTSHIDWSALEAAVYKGDFLAVNAQLELATIGEQQSPAYLASRAQAHIAAGASDSAMACLDRFLGLVPDDGWALRMHAGLKADAGLYIDAVRLFRRAARIAPTEPSVHANLAQVLALTGQHAEALVEIGLALQINPSSAETHLIAGRIHEQSLDILAARTAYRRACELIPTLAQGMAGLARCARAIGDFPAAEKYFLHAASLGGLPESLEYDIGMAQYHQHRYQDALATLEPLAAGDPIRQEIQYVRANILISSGDFTGGWNAYESRKRLPAWTASAPSLAEWNGRRAKLGERLIVTADQGYGDTIMFSRFLADVHKLGWHVTLRCLSALVPVMRGVEGIAEVVSLDQDADQLEGDAHAWLLSLPLLLGIDLARIDCPVPYLKTPMHSRADWHARVPGGKFNVGLSWTGSAQNTYNVIRSFDPELLRRCLSRVPGIALHSLQLPAVGVAACPQGVVDHGAYLLDFAETTAQIGELDLVICAESAIAHLAGALGVPAWIPMANYADWRWQIAGRESPWYDSVRLFHQKVPMEWQDVFDEMAAALPAQMCAE